MLLALTSRSYLGHAARCIYCQYTSCITPTRGVNAKFVKNICLMQKNTCHACMCTTIASQRSPLKHDSPDDYILRKLFPVVEKRYKENFLQSGSVTATNLIADLYAMSSLDLVQAISLIVASNQKKSKQLSLIEMLLVQHLYNLPVQLILQACHGLYMQNHNLRTFISHAFSVIDETFDDLCLSSSEVTCLFLYVFVQRTAPGSFFTKVQSFMERNLQNFHIDDLSIISLGFFRANARISSYKLLDAMAQKLLNEVETVNSYLLMNLMKVFRHANFRKSSFYSQLGDRMVSIEFAQKSDSVVPLMHIAFTFASIPVQHNDLFESILKQFENLHFDVGLRTKEISKFVWACGVLQFYPSSHISRYSQLLDIFLKSDVHHKDFAGTCVEMMEGLAYLQIFPYDFLSKCLSADLVCQLLDVEDCKSRSHQLLFLHHTATLECCDYTGNLLSKSSLNKIDSLLQTKTNEMEKEKMVRKGFASVFASLQLSLGDDKVICSRPLSHFRTPVPATYTPRRLAAVTNQLRNVGCIHAVIEDWRNFFNVNIWSKCDNLLMESLAVCLKEILPADIGNSIKQMCRVTNKLADMLDICFGDCVRIKAHTTSFICRAFGTNSDCDSSLCVYYDGCVIESHENSKHIGTNDAFVRLEKLICSDADEVCVKLFVQRPNNHLQQSCSQKEHISKWGKRVQVLHGMCVTVGCRINLSHMRLAQVNGIVVCEVLSCLPDSRTDNLTAVRITPTTDIQICDVNSWECYEALHEIQRFVSSVSVVGLDEECQRLANLLGSTSVYPDPNGVLLFGPPGCGKTAMVRQVAAECSAVLLELSCSNIFANPNNVGSIRDLEFVFCKARRLCKETSCILYIDDVDYFFPSRQKKHCYKHKCFSSALLNELSIPIKHKSCGFLVVMATSKTLEIDDELFRSCLILDRINLTIPSSEQRIKIIRHHLMNFHLSEDVDLDWIVSATSGCVGEDIALICRQAQMEALQRLQLTGDVTHNQCIICLEDLEAALRHVKPLLQHGVDSVVENRDISWDDIGGLDDVKLKLQQVVEWPLRYPEAYVSLGLKLVKGILLTGPPGCGKTLLAQASASACHVTFLSLSCAQIFSSYVGDSEKMISKTFQKAHALAPSILFLDEIDGIVGKRDTGTSASERVLSTLLNELDGIGIKTDVGGAFRNFKDTLQSVNIDVSSNSAVPFARKIIEHARDSHVLVIGATNRPEMLDSALLRPGRMDLIINVGPSDFAGRLQTLKVHTKSMPLSQNVDLSMIAKRTQGYTGADIHLICQQAALFAIKESIDSQPYIEMKHFEQVLDFSKPSSYM